MNAVSAIPNPKLKAPSNPFSVLPLTIGCSSGRIPRQQIDELDDVIRGRVNFSRAANVSTKHIMRVAIGFVLLTCGTPVLASAGGRASGIPPPSLRIVLKVTGPTPFPASLVEAAVREAHIIWAPHRVAIGLRGRTSPDWDADDAIPLSIVFTKPIDDAATRWTSPLGGITFSPDGVPNSVIFVFNQPLVRLATAPGVLNSRHFQWPAALRDTVIGRVLGRVLAHEIGHFIFRSPAHSRSGLMRSRQVMEDLVSPDRRPLGLTPIDVEHLQVMLDATRPLVGTEPPASVGSSASLGEPH